LDLPFDWTGVSAYKDMGATSPLWSPDGSRLAIFDEKRVVFIRL
jgi:hypothetical protein